MVLVLSQHISSRGLVPCSSPQSLFPFRFSTLYICYTSFLGEGKDFAVSRRFLLIYVFIFNKLCLKTLLLQNLSSDLAQLSSSSTILSQKVGWTCTKWHRRERDWERKGGGWVCRVLLSFIPPPPTPLSLSLFYGIHSLHVYPTFCERMVKEGGK